MKFFKTVSLLIVSLFGTVCSVNAEPPGELEHKIVDAQKRFEQSRNVLRAKNPKLFYDFDANRWTEECYAAEETFRKCYPAEYGEYINSKMELDDLLYMSYVCHMNSVCK